MPLDLHWFFYRLPKNVAIYRFGGIQATRKKTKPLQLTLKRGRESGLYKRKRNMSEPKNMCRLRCIYETSIPIVHISSKGTLPSCNYKAIWAIKLSGVWPFSEEVSWVEENQRDIPKGRLRAEHMSVSQFFMPHSVSLILPERLD